MPAAAAITRRAYKANNFSKISMDLIQRGLEKSVNINFIILETFSYKILLIIFLVNFIKSKQLTV